MKDAGGGCVWIFFIGLWQRQRNFRQDQQQTKTLALFQNLIISFCLLQSLPNAIHASARGGKLLLWAVSTMLYQRGVISVGMVDKQKSKEQIELNWMFLFLRSFLNRTFSLLFFAVELNFKFKQPFQPSWWHHANICFSLLCYIVWRVLLYPPLQMFRLITMNHCMSGEPYSQSYSDAPNTQSGVFILSSVFIRRVTARHFFVRRAKRDNTAF